jgi:hypothetical protein
MVHYAARGGMEGGMKYDISDDALHQGVTALVKKMMAGQRGWKKDSNLDLLEFQIEGIISKHLDGYGGIKLQLTGARRGVA